MMVDIFQSLLGFIFNYMYVRVSECGCVHVPVVPEVARK